MRDYTNERTELWRGLRRRRVPLQESFVHQGIKIERRGKRWRWRARLHGRVVTCSTSTLGEARDRLEEFASRRESDSTRAIPQSYKSLSIGDLCEAWFIDKKPRSRLQPPSNTAYTSEFTSGLRLVTRMQAGSARASWRLSMPRCVGSRRRNRTTSFVKRSSGGYAMTYCAGRRTLVLSCGHRGEPVPITTASTTRMIASLLSTRS